MGAYFWRAWLLCGALDLGYAALTTLWAGKPASNMLATVASGPFGRAALGWGLVGALAGILVHFALMAVMVAAFALLWRQPAVARRGPWIAGALYGLALYLVMYWIVLPLRWPAVHPDVDPQRIAIALLPHIALVGIPMALIARRTLTGKDQRP